MISAQRVRIAAFQILYGLDANKAQDQPGERLLQSLRESVMNESEALEPRELRQAEKLAIEAYANRRQADELFEELSPAWPVSRQPAVDRAILRLAYHEMAHGKAPPKVAIDEAIDMARQFSTEKSPSFVNALLDAAMRKLAGAETVETVEPVNPPEPRAC